MSAANHEKPAPPDRDRRARQADRLGRILTVLRLIQSRGKWNVRAIAQELEVTERTVYRDLQALEFAGVPYYYDTDAESYRVRNDYRFPVPNLTKEEIIGQAVASAITKAPGLDAAGGAGLTTQKIAAAACEDVKQLLADAEQVVSVLGLQLAEHIGQHDIIRKPRTFNPIKDVRCKNPGKVAQFTRRDAKGQITKYGGSWLCGEYRQRGNVWHYTMGKLHNSDGKTEHPAIMHFGLVRDLIHSFSDPADLVFDPFCGEGTTPLAAKQLRRHYLGFEISPYWVKRSIQRLKKSDLS